MLTKVTLGAAAAAFTALLVMTMASVGTQGMGALLANPWGQVTLADVYLGFLCFIVVIAAVERNLVAIILWSLATVLIGNAVAAVWLLVRGLPALAELRRAADSAPG